MSNSLKASKLMINELVMEKQEFKERYFVHVVSFVFTRLIFLKTVCHLLYFYSRFRD